MMMKKISYLAIAVSLVTLAGCGGGGSGDSGMTAGGNNTGNGSGDTKLKCDRGILLNSNLTAKSIFDEPLYSITYDYKDISTDADHPYHNILNQLYALEISRGNKNSQMLYTNFKPIHNTNLQDMEQSSEEIKSHYNLNSSGLFSQKELKKQNQGWPLLYLASTQANENSSQYTASISSFNDQCSLTSNKLDFDFEKIDLSNKKISDILPENIMTGSPKNLDYKYIAEQVGAILRDEGLFGKKDYLEKMLKSTDTFPKGSYVYVPRTAIYTDIQFSFGDTDITDYKTLDEWFSARYGKSSYQYKHDKFANLNVIYSIDSNGNPVYGAADPAIEMNGKIYDGEWNIKGDILSPNYGLKTNYGNGFDVENFDSKGDYAFYNKTAYEFISAQIQTYYK